MRIILPLILCLSVAGCALTSHIATKLLVPAKQGIHATANIGDNKKTLSVGNSEDTTTISSDDGTVNVNKIPKIVWVYVGFLEALLNMVFFFVGLNMMPLKFCLKRRKQIRKYLAKK